MGYSEYSHMGYSEYSHGPYQRLAGAGRVEQLRDHVLARNHLNSAHLLPYRSIGGLCHAAPWAIGPARPAAINSY